MAVQHEAERIMSSIERKGWERGLAEGHAEKHGALVRMVLRQLQVKFGEVPAEDRMLLEKLPDEQLEELSIAVLTAVSYTEWKGLLRELSRNRG